VPAPRRRTLRHRLLRPTIVMPRRMTITGTRIPRQTRVPQALPISCNVRVGTGALARPVEQRSTPRPLSGNFCKISCVQETKVVRSALTTYSHVELRSTGRAWTPVPTRTVLVPQLARKTNRSLLRLCSCRAALDWTGVDARPYMVIASSPASPKSKSRQLSLTASC